MRIYRLGSTPENVVYATSTDERTFYRLEGSLFGGLTPTDEVVEDDAILAPLDPWAVIGIAVNYAAHGAEMKKDGVGPGARPDYPVYFLKLPSSVIGPQIPIVLPRKLHSDKVDFEAELAVVIGRRAKNVAAEDALNYVLGYCCANDITARDWQKEWGGGQFCRGKGMDTFCPLGPHLVTVDDPAVADVGNLAIRGYLNGELMQESNTNQMLFTIPELIAFLSGSTTLEPGTVILTGTPSGVGMARTPPRFLQRGDTYRVEIGGLGALENPVVEEVV